MSKPGFSYFELQATWGFTKHMGGQKATAELAETCHLGQDSNFLVIGCGIGASTCYLVQKLGCRGTGIDLSEGMVAWSQKRAQRAGLASQLEFKVADAQNLPFEDGAFDAVLCESVNAFIPNRARAFGEYARVTRPGGYVGFNECTWIQPPPQELVDFVYRAMDRAVFETPACWQVLLEQASLTDVQAHTYKVTALRQWLDEMEQMRSGSFGETMRAWNSFFGLLFKSPEFRSYAKGLVPSPKVISTLFKCLGYTLCVGKK
ncbi:MAG TPA: class I SAM-dependent methyltransferase [Anaerolineaceae bacterium]